MRAGRMDQELIFQKKIKTRTDFGAQAEEWVEDFTISGRFEPVNSSEFHENWKRFTESTARFLVRQPLPRPIDSATHRIVMNRDFTSPVETSTWQIFPPIPLQGRPFILQIEGSEIL